MAAEGFPQPCMWLLSWPLPFHSRKKKKLRYYSNFIQYVKCLLPWPVFMGRSGDRCFHTATCPIMSFNPELSFKLRAIGDCGFASWGFAIPWAYWTLLRSK
jgi:hypothetical protein